MSDERRERYAAAFYGMATPHHLSAEDWRLVDAAMAVADEEIRAAKLEGAQIVAANYVAERSRLRAELEEKAEALRFADEEYQKLGKHLSEAEATLSRVNAVLDESGESESASTLVELIRNTLNGADDASS